MPKYPNRRYTAKMDPFDVVVGPWVTEKSTESIEERNVYTLEVAMAATKLDVRQAVEKIWGVKVLSVRTIVTAGKRQRFGRKVGFRRDRKKALVKLAEGQGIDAVRP